MVGFEVLTAVVMKSSVFGVITPCSNLAACIILISCLAYSSTLKMEVTCYSETSINFYQTTRYYVYESGN
jgi:hypothetical protein